MNYQNIVVDFVYRTRKNLEYIDEHINDPSVKIFETTQLINSMLGLLIFPEQRYFNNIPEISLKELLEQGWPRIEPTKRVKGSPDFVDCSNLKDLMKCLRNSIAHFNIKFLANEKDEIIGLRIWNIDLRKKTKPITWEADLSLYDLRLITFKFIELMESYSI